MKRIPIRSHYRALFTCLLLLTGSVWGSNELRLLSEAAQASRNDNAEAKHEARSEETNPESMPRTANAADSSAEDVPVVNPERVIAGYGGVGGGDFVDWASGFKPTIFVTVGSAYDSNLLLTDGNLHPELGEWVYWMRLGMGLAGGPGLTENGLGLYYGANVDASFFAYTSGVGEAGRGNVEPRIAAYLGARGGVTDVRFDGAYRLNKGNTVDFGDLDREAGRAEGSVQRFGVSGMRMLDHGSLRGGVAFERQDFERETRLNDVNQVTWDAAWFNDPIWLDKTSIGFGLRGGSYDADRNVEQTYWTPSLRAILEHSPKTNFYSSAGYAFRNFEGPNAIGESGSAMFEVGMNWGMTQATALHFAAYRTYNPSLIAAYQDFDVDGAVIGIDHALPRDFSILLDAAFERADYFSTIEGVDDGRTDDYWRLGVSLSHPINVTPLLPGFISAFLYWNENNSTESQSDFEQYFAGMRVDVTSGEKPVNRGGRFTGPGFRNTLSGH